MTFTDRKTYRRIASHYILSPAGLVRNGIVTFDNGGLVVDVSSAEDVDSLPGVEFHSGILIPGMVNAHTHLELSYLKGAIAEKGGFAAFAAGLGAVRDKFTREQMVSAAHFHDAQMWSEGVSAAGDICNSDITFPVKTQSRIAYHSFLELYGLGASTDAPIHPLKDSADRSALRWSTTPHSTYSLNEAGFRAAAGGPSNEPISIHFMESPAELDLYLGHGEFLEWYGKKGWTTDFSDKYLSPAQRIVKNIPQSKSVMLVHNVCVRDEDIELLAGHFGDNLTWVVCPCSNRYITGSRPPVDLLRRRGCRIAIGTDSLASNHALSMAEELKMLEGILLEEALAWVTVNGARALGLSDRYGSFEKGRSPGAAVVCGVDWNKMTVTPDIAIKRVL